MNDCKTRLKYTCEKVIIVTHSMGGLVARMCAKKTHIILWVLYMVFNLLSAQERLITGCVRDGKISQAAWRSVQTL
ncbi:GPI inositol-deacylase [Pseudomonas sp. KU26590]|uniref:hypothetical protein n=1 Tax=Pseudomonas sp. KU26590 TaxID=2991051 RepID=UPI00223DBC4E|nr:hypothetical protein [Pseudomonas sp. KU26590]UZJ58435.1 GPI inositol-deacylase [Pseudomonas sp. KU26590]